MKELHNHKFSNTTCISKEIMLRYINKQLSKNELYEVEKHMLDCALCTDAYEGMQYAQNSSILFAIDNKINQRVGVGNFKAPIMKNLMVAASILVIVFGAYFTFNFFNNAVDEEIGLALNNEELPKKEKTIDKNEGTGVVEDNSIINSQDNATISASSGKDAVLYENEEKLKQDEKYRTTLNDLGPIVAAAEQVPELVDNSNTDMVDELEMVVDEEEVGVLTNETKTITRVNKSEEKSEKRLEFANNTNSDNRKGDNFINSTVQNEPTTVSGEGASFGYSPSEANKTGELSKNEVKKAKNKIRSTGNKKRRYKSSAPTTEYFSGGKLEEESDFRDRNQQKTITIDSYKVVDYTEEYQTAYDIKNEDKIDTKSISADFESKEDKDVAEKEMDDNIVEITYKETLENAIKLYKHKKYELAIEQFDIILKEHPDEVNGLFYGGLSSYHLQRYDAAKEKLDLVLKNKETEFNEEAKWYKTLTLIELKQAEKAKVLLKEIIKMNRFYKIKAEEKLKEL